MQVILASSSPYRSQLLKQIRLPFAVVRPEVDEMPLLKRKLPPAEIARQLARLKGEAVASKHKDSLVIASDQIAHCDGQLLAKPETAANAARQLSLLSGREHELVTAIWVRHPQKGEVVHVDETRIRFRRLSPSEIEAYIHLEKPLDCAGGYKFEQAGLNLIEKIETDDHTAIIGLPCLALIRILKEWELPLPICWPQGGATT
jgi:septum formation protein